MWGTDATACLTTRGNATVFIAVDHCTQQCAGIHAARPGTRFEALEPLRHDHGSQYLSDHFQGELRFLGIRSSPSFVAAPEGNGCAERFIPALKERYNRRWRVERHGHRTPTAVREALHRTIGVAA